MNKQLFYVIFIKEEVLLSRKRILLGKRGEMFDTIYMYLQLETDFEIV